MKKMLALLLPLIFVISSCESSYPGDTPESVIYDLQCMVFYDHSETMLGDAAESTLTNISWTVGETRLVDGGKDVEATLKGTVIDTDIVISVDFIVFYPYHVSYDNITSSIESVTVDGIYSEAEEDINIVMEYIFS